MNKLYMCVIAAAVSFGCFATTDMYGGSDSTIGIGEDAKPSGSNVIAFGDYSTSGSSSLNNSVALGTRSMYGGYNMSGVTAIGDCALLNSSNCLNTIAIGSRALANTAGATNVVAIGSQLIIDGQADMFAIRQNAWTPYAQAPLYWDGSHLYSNGTIIGGGGGNVGSAKNGIIIGDADNLTVNTNTFIKVLFPAMGDGGGYGFGWYSTFGLSYCVWGSDVYPEADVFFPDISSHAGETMATLTDATNIVNYAVTNALANSISSFNEFNVYSYTNSNGLVFFFDSTNQLNHVLYVENTKNGRRVYPNALTHISGGKYREYHFDGAIFQTTDETPYSDFVVHPFGDYSFEWIAYPESSAATPSSGYESSRKFYNVGVTDIPTYAGAASYHNAKGRVDGCYLKYNTETGNIDVYISGTSGKIGTLNVN